MTYLLQCHRVQHTLILPHTNAHRLWMEMEMDQCLYSAFLHPSQWAPKALYNALTHSPFTHTFIRQWRPGMPSTGAYEPRPIGGNLG